MLKKLFIQVFFVPSILFFISTSSIAALIDNGNGTITDTDKNLMWLQDTRSSSPAISRTDWENANIWANSSLFAGYDDWRLPRAFDPLNPNLPCSGLSCTESELKTLFSVSLGNSGGMRTNDGPFLFDLEQTWFWTDAFAETADSSWGNYDPSENHYWYVDFDSGSQIHDFGGAYFTLNTWLVRSMNLPGSELHQTPEPATIVFLISGLIGLFLFKKK